MNTDSKAMALTFVVAAALAVFAVDAAARDAGAAEAQRRSAAAPQAPVATAARPLDGATPEELKGAYLRCDALATTEHFDADAATACSIVYEALKARVFGGSTDRLVAWMRQQPGPAARWAARAAR